MEVKEEFIFPCPGYIINPKTKRKVKITGPTGSQLMEKYNKQIEQIKDNLILKEIQSNLPFDLQQIILCDYSLSIEDRYLLSLEGVPFENRKQELLFWEGRSVDISDYYTFF